MSVQNLPLEGIRVMDFGIGTAGRFATTALAHFGAEVILIEDAVRRRESRFEGRLTEHKKKNADSPNLSPHFNKWSTNKLSFSVSLKQPGGQELIRRLVKVSDAVTNNLLPSSVKGMGLDYEDLAKIKPDIIVLNMPAMGKGGPYQDFRSLSWNLQAQAGWNCISGFPDRMPINPSPYSHGDHSCNPMHGAIALLSALIHRARTGEGQEIDLSQLESSVCFTETAVFQYMVNGAIPPRIGNHLPYAAPHGVYRCLGDERWCAIAVFTQEEWAALCRVMGRTELLKNPLFTNLEDRLNNQELLDNIVESWTKNRSDESVMEELQKAGIAAGVVQNVEDLLINDPQLQQREHWVKVKHPEAGELTLEQWSFRFSEIKSNKFRHAPLIGEHNNYVLKEILHMDDEEIKHYQLEGVFGI